MVINLSVTVPDDAKPSEVAYAISCAMVGACDTMRKNPMLDVDEMWELDLPTDLRASNAQLFRSE